MNLSTDPVPETKFCLFLDKLPVELRIEIYKLAFAVEEVDDEVELLLAKPPSHTLLLVCRHVRSEAQEIYHAARRHFWGTTSFKMSLGEVAALQSYNEMFDQLSPSTIRTTIDDITKLRTEFALATTAVAVNITLIDARGGWITELRRSLETTRNQGQAYEGPWLVDYIFYGYGDAQQTALVSVHSAREDLMRCCREATRCKPLHAQILYMTKAFDLKMASIRARRSRG